MNSKSDKPINCIFQFHSCIETASMKSIIQLIKKQLFAFSFVNLGHYIHKKLINIQMAKKEVKQESFLQDTLAWFKTLFGAILVVMIINGVAVASFVVPTSSMERTVMTGDFLFVNKFIFGPTTPQVIPFVNEPLPFYKFPGVRNPKLNDVIVFIYPGNRDEIKPSVFNYYLKRCCGTPGDTVVVKNKQLFVNGKMIKLAPNGVLLPDFQAPDHIANYPYGTTFTRDNWGPIRIPKEGDILELSSIENIKKWVVLIVREGNDVELVGDQVYINKKIEKQYKVKGNYYFGMGDNRDNSADSREWGLIPERNIIGTPMVVYWSWDTNLSMSEIGEKLSSIRWSRIGKLIK